MISCLNPATSNPLRLLVRDYSFHLLNICDSNELNVLF